MPPRILIFVGLSGDGPRAAAGAACEMAPPGSARPLTLDPAQADSTVRRTADTLAEHLALRPVAWELALLARVTELLRERPDATVVIDAARPPALLRLLEAADLARARLDAGRPAASASTLAAQRSLQAAPELPVLRAAATGGDLLRAPELTTVGLAAPLGPPAGAGTVHAHHPDVAALAARTALTFAGVTVLAGTLPNDPEQAAQAVVDGGGAPAAGRDPAPVITATPGGAELKLTLPDLPDDLRAVRSGGELALHGAGLSRRLRAPISLGALVPGGVSAAADGTIVATFGAPSPPPTDHAPAPARTDAGDLA